MAPRALTQRRMWLAPSPQNRVSRLCCNVGPRQLHDRTAPIVARAATWQKRHAALWNLLVPSSGPCKTVLGEVIRIAGRVADELQRNGGVNWDYHYDAMLKAFCAHVASGHGLAAALIAKCRAIAAKGRRRDDEDGNRRLAELAVAWIELNSTRRRYRYHRLRTRVDQRVRGRSDR